MSARYEVGDKVLIDGAPFNVTSVASPISHSTAATPARLKTTPVRSFVEKYVSTRKTGPGGYFRDYDRWMEFRHALADSSGFGACNYWHNHYGATKAELRRAMNENFVELEARFWQSLVQLSWKRLTLDETRYV